MASSVDSPEARSNQSGLSFRRNECPVFTYLFTETPPAAEVFPALLFPGAEQMAFGITVPCARRRFDVNWSIHLQAETTDRQLLGVQ